MKLTCDARELSEAVSIAATVVPSRSSKPVLMNVALVAKDGQLEVLGTDLEVSLRIHVRRVEVESDGAVLINASRASQILKELSAERVELSADEHSGCVIKTAGSRFHVYGEDFGEYPAVASFGDESAAFAFPTKDFREMVTKTSFAAHVEKTRYAMNGILVQRNDADLVFVATDGKRLAMMKRPISTGAEPHSAVVPTKAMNTVTRLLSQDEATVLMRFEDSQVLFKSNDAEVFARLVEGHYPPYEQVIPKELSKTLDLDREEFSRALRKASLLTTRDSQSVRFFFHDDGLDLSARVVDVGESRVHVDLPYAYEELSIGFNPQYIIDALKVIESQRFSLKLSTTKGAALIEEEGGLTYVVMPINLGDD